LEKPLSRIAGLRFHPKGGPLDATAWRGCEIRRELLKLSASFRVIGVLPEEVRMAAIRKALVLSLVTSVGTLSAQQAPPRPDAAAFELTSIKRNVSGPENASNRNQPNGSFTGTNVTLRPFIARAYEVRVFQVTGGPQWIDFDRFDIIGRGPEGTPTAMRPPMLRGLLADRFRLVTHTETREQPVYALVLARSDGRLGPQLKRSPLPCGAPGASCGVDESVNGGIGTITTWGVPMDRIAAALANSSVNRFVINRTGLEGGFDVVELRFAAEGFGQPAANRPDAPPSIFTAVEEQLGLTLEPTRGPVPFVVIDSIQPPTAD
jgi:uncharacterized protein (TIGR03435 family)